MLEGRNFEEQFDEAAERLNAGRTEALSHTRQALASLLVAESHLLAAASKVFGTPEDDRLCSLSQDVENIECDIRKQVERMESLI